MLQKYSCLFLTGRKKKKQSGFLFKFILDLVGFQYIAINFMIF
jgi:hypothetical protein